MMLKEIIEEMKKELIINKRSKIIHSFTRSANINIIEKYLPDLEKATELQEEMSLLIKNDIKESINNAVFVGFNKQVALLQNKEKIELLEKYYNKSWEEIIMESI
jgi:hypothetical protein